MTEEAPLLINFEL